MKATTYTAKFNGQVIDTRTSKTVTYTHAAIIKHPTTGELIVARWSKTAKAAATKLPHGWESLRVATVAVEAPAAELPAGVTMNAQRILSGPVKAMLALYESGAATLTDAGDLVLN